LFAVAMTAMVMVVFSEAASLAENEDVGIQAGGSMVDSVSSEADYERLFVAKSRVKRGLLCDAICAGRGNCRVAQGNYSTTCGRNRVCVCD
jgi:hypothetical protein